MRRSTRPVDRRDGWYHISPDDASALLASQPMNRPIRQRKVDQIAAAISAGEWRPNGESIILDEEGLLLDGQGRCSAVVAAGRPIETYVVHGISRSHFPSIDALAQIRNAADVLAMSGAQNYAITAATIRLWIALEATGNIGSTINSVPVSNAAVNAFFSEHGDELRTAYQELTDIDSRWPRLCIGVITPSAFYYIFVKARRISPTKATSFARGFLIGERLEKGSPMLLLRNRTAETTAGTQVYARLAVGIKAFNAHLFDRQLGVLKYDSRQKFPRIGELL